MLVIWNLTDNPVLSARHPFLAHPPLPWRLVDQETGEKDEADARFLGVLTLDATETNALPWGPALGIRRPNLAVDMLMYWEEIQQASLSPDSGTRDLAHQWALMAHDAAHRWMDIARDARFFTMELGNDKIVLRRAHGITSFRAFAGETQLGGRNTANIWTWLLRGLLQLTASNTILVEADHPLVAHGTHVESDFETPLPFLDRERTSMVWLTLKSLDPPLEHTGALNDDVRAIFRAYYHSLAHGQPALSQRVRFPTSDRVFLLHPHFLFYLFKEKNIHESSILEIQPLYQHWMILASLPRAVETRIQEEQKVFRVFVGPRAAGGLFVVKWLKGGLLVIDDYTQLDRTVVVRSPFGRMIALLKLLTANKWLNGALVHKQFVGEMPVIEHVWQKDPNYVFIS